MAGEQWWVIQAPAERTGIQKIEYVQATSRQQATETLPGATFVGGPYPTEAAARKAHPGTTGPHGTAPADGASPGSISDAKDLPDPLAGIDAVGHFFSALEDGSLWRSLAWIVVGVLMVLAGIMLWLKKAVPIPPVVPV